MSKIKHKFIEHIINVDTETLILGTFNLDAQENNAEFFYGRSKNHLWRLLPVAFGKPELKSASKKEKLAFMKEEKVDFIDVISEVDVEEGEESNYSDGYIDSRVSQWNTVIDKIEKLTHLKKVFFTRKTYSDIPKMKQHVQEIEKYCKENSILFQVLPTPARFYNENKQEEWIQRFL